MVSIYRLAYSAIETKPSPFVSVAWNKAVISAALTTPSPSVSNKAAYAGLELTKAWIWAANSSSLSCPSLFVS